jgi:purine-binding chemotaxis protein CheW
MPHNPSTIVFGGFALGSMQLALPLSAVREVIACTSWFPVPSPAACVVGGINFRDVIVPLLDLRILLGRCVEMPAYPCAVIVVHDGHILALLVDEVTGVFSCDADKLNRINVNDPVAAIFFASVRRPDNLELVSVLSPQAIWALPQMPTVVDPEPQRQLLANATEEPLDASRTVPMLLLRCGTFALAIDAMVVHATIANPLVMASPLSMGQHCLGLIEYGGQNIPALDFQGFCGLGSAGAGMCAQAFIISYGDGQIAFLIGEVVDVVGTSAEDLIAVPVFALPHPTLFAGAIASSVLPPEVIERSRLQASQYLVIDAAALKGCCELIALSRINTNADDARERASVADGSRRSMIIYDLSGETATPLEQLAMILPFETDVLSFDKNQALLGFLVNRGRSIPVLNLNHGSAAADFEITATASVLVVESDGELIGFPVQSLKAIEAATWEPVVPHHLSTRDAINERARATASKKWALVGTGEAERMLPVQDLLAVARSFQQAQ